MSVEKWKTPLLLGVIVCPFLFAGCTTQSADKLTESLSVAPSRERPYAYSDKDRECLARAMFFESQRSSREGLVAVGTVVMNRLKSGEHGQTVCEVVGEKGQFAPGVMTRRMNSAALPDVQEAAEAVLKGERHTKVKEAMYFHTAGLKFPYKNMHYVLVAGGNAFYERRRRKPPRPAVAETAIAAAQPAVETKVASLTPAPVVATRIAAAATLPSAATETVASADLIELPDQVAIAPSSPDRIDEFPPAPQLADSAQPTVDTAQAVADVSDAAPDGAMSFEASPEAADAIGAMILDQNRAVEAFQ